ncbi:hypothetical protein SMC3_05870 [Candidatus Cryosericum hinesii]|jgi:hypothetical protein|uniref:Uncharacterized protein n=2 Tax=Candidatus Cryosericum TaxID=2498709 RepID=A0A398DL09_9BACT|nr:hypothetical protein [Candidatus Cryosericum hinesii]RIE09021.1 hypothetical protein SMC4_06505 [Candidatus Cryosericum hinesii]RIE12787.1 hypothetical protein SMC3_05870 [Candidatus Cryosericum hinesii]RIE12841.1 hypothetical protein SMC2_06245 [Candidatus Cryosericum hinesii]
MSHTTLTNENTLDQWVRGHAREAQGVIVDLVRRLVAASVPGPRERRFPGGDSIEQPGEDGRLVTDFDFEPFIPLGLSLWEIGTGISPREKATSDYDKLTENTLTEVRKEATFIFVTPLSGRRGWVYSGRARSQVDWRAERAQRGEWRDVRVIDGTKLVDWLSYFPSVDTWLAGIMDIPVQAIDTPEQHWTDVSTIGDPPPLIPELFLANRDDACNRLEEVFAGTALQLRLTTHFPGQLANFVSAYVAAMSTNARIEAVSRCIIVSNSDAWNQITKSGLLKGHVLVAAFSLDDTDTDGALLLERAKRAGHAVVFAGLPGGIPHPNTASLPSPRIQQVAEALQKAGYGEERARVLAQKSGGNLDMLLRLLQHLSTMPEWAQKTDAGDLKIAQLLGAWNENLPADTAIVEQLSKKAYGEWIEKMREIALRPNTPLVQHGGIWKVTARYEGWYSLGSCIFDEDLDVLRRIATDILLEPDPKFELSTEQRFAASVHGKVLGHSDQLRKGIADTLALLGSQQKALTSTTAGKAEQVATLAVRDILLGANWVLWASLNDLLPLLAEAAPHEFLDIIEKTLHSTPCPFDAVFAQESSEFGGGNYMTGVLWALETLAWDPDYLITVAVILGELAARDPGGKWGNRPANSLSTILQPWLPQTCASVAQRKAAVQAVLREFPDVGWKLLLDLLPDAHKVSMGSRRPAWRETIPDDWIEGVSQREHWKQVCVYADLAVDVVKNDVSRLVQLTDRLDDLPEPARKQLLTHFGSDSVTSIPEADRFQLWDHLMYLVAKHRGFAGAEWALKPEIVDEIDAVAHALAPRTPSLIHRRLFRSDYLEFFDDKIGYDEQERQLDEQQQKALQEVCAAEGPEGLLTFATSVESPMRVGNALGAIADSTIDGLFLPSLLNTETRSSLREFVGGFIWRRFHVQGWQWVDGLGAQAWLLVDRGQLLAFLPFSSETWERASLWLSDDESPYWSRAAVNPYMADEKLAFAAGRLVKYGRPYAAILCLERMAHEKQHLDSEQVVGTLLATLDTVEKPPQGRGDAIAKLIQTLQDDQAANREKVMQVEWAFVPLLDGHLGATARFLGRRLAEEPSFFCEVIRAVFRSEQEADIKPELTEEQKRIAGNAYSLLDEWRIPPGSREDGTFDGDALHKWFGSMKSISGESGHLGIAMTMAGKVLMYVPADPNGLWLHRAAAEELNAGDADDLRSGYQTGLFNSRGGHWVDPKGTEERNLAKKYREQADQIELAGYQRLAATLRQLAHEYDHEAERVGRDNEFNE